jgi:tetratricopeptide (TPR) repeat protein/tRNA A-37 threonylcarbamoyl transferase component Bud32
VDAAQFKRIDNVCDDFERAWQEGSRPRLEDYLGQVTEADRATLYDELLRLDLHYRQLADSPSPTAGSTFGPPAVPGYEMLEELGRGGMGVVYKARQVKANRLVALKMILAGQYTSLEARLRFQIEAEAVARLSHPHVVRLFEVGEHERWPFFSLEFCPGGSLKKRLAGQPQPPRQAAVLAEKLARAVAAAHAQGLLHRDLKPDNVLLGEDGEPRITDFGLARRKTDPGMTQSGAVVGTPSYMAPEQAQGKKDVGPAIDIYALGAVLYECLTGRPPFLADSPVDTLAQLVTTEPVPPRRLNPQVPIDLETICLKCLQKDPGKRYASATDLAQDLGRFLAGEPILARPVGALERAVKWVRRNPVAAILVAVLLLVVLAGISGVWLWQQQRTAVLARQREADQNALAILERGQALLKEGWQANDLGRLKDARAEANQAAEVIGTGFVTPAVQQQVVVFQLEVERRSRQAAKNSDLLVALLNVSAPPEPTYYSRAAEQGRDKILPRSSVEEQYTRAFRRWGVDVDTTAEAEMVAQWKDQPRPVLEEIIAALDDWMLARRREYPEGKWRRLLRVARELDPSPHRQELRAVLAGDHQGRSRAVAGLAVSLAGTGQPWAALAELGCARPAHLRRLRAQMKPATDPVISVVLLARVCREARDFVGAEEVLREALAARPDQVVLLHILGVLLKRQGPPRLGEAIECFRAVRARQPDLGSPLASALVQAGRYAEAEAVLHDLVRRQPRNPDLQVSLGNALYRQKKLNEAEAAYREAIRLEPDSAPGYLGLGSALKAQDRLDDAEAASRKACLLDPKYPETHYHLGCDLLARNKVNEAVPTFRKAIALRPDYVWAHNNLGLALVAQKKLDEAMAAYRRAIAIDPDFAGPYINLGNVLFWQNRVDEAVAAFRKAGQLQPDLVVAHYNLGQLLGLQKKWGEAEAAYRQTIAHQPDHAGAHYNLGVVLLEQHKLDEAVRALRLAIHFRPENAQAHYGLGRTLFLQRKSDEAESPYRQAIALRPHYAEAHCNLGNILRGKGQFKESLAAYRRGHELGSKSSGWTFPSIDWVRQAERLVELEGKLPAVLEGSAKPASAAEQVEFARLCVFKKLHATAARFYRDAFAAVPQLAQDVRSSNRYHAARVAALAGCGQGKDADRLVDRERDSWRQQALDWLRADLTWWEGALDRDNAQTRAVVSRWLRSWQSDRDLAGVRDRAALGQLPEAERKQWRKLWAQVTALLALASER